MRIFNSSSYIVIHSRNRIMTKFITSSIRHIMQHNIEYLRSSRSLPLISDCRHRCLIDIFLRESQNKCVVNSSRSSAEFGEETVILRVHSLSTFHIRDVTTISSPHNISAYIAATTHDLIWPYLAGRVSPSCLS